MPFGERAPHGEIAAFDIAQFAHRVQNWPPPEGVAAEGYQSDSVHFARRLPLGGERRGEEAASQGSQERSPIHHHSIIW